MSNGDLMSKTVLFFPGQASQYVGMGKDLFDSSEAVRQLYQLASKEIGADIAALSFEGPAEELKRTRFTQPAILLHSLAFWLGPVEGLVRQLWEFLLTFSMYPRTLFTGVLKILLFTVIPAGFIGFLPAELLQSFSVAGLLYVLGGASGYMLLALWVFAAGDELAQERWIEGRDGELADWAADLIGALVGLLAGGFLLRLLIERPRRS